MLALEAEEPEPGPAFLAALADPERRPIPFRTAVVVAHPDDETIGCGALLPRLAEVTVIHVTDGAPGNLADAHARGFPTASAYAAARRAELEAAARLAGLPPDRLVALGWPDQEASRHLAAIARELARSLAGAEIVITHAYEGGHPDHDATAFAAHAACRLMARERRPAPALIELPLYRLGPEGMAAQSFVPLPSRPEVTVILTAGERELKQAMYAAHRSQSDVLAAFGTEVERYRAAPDHDFTQLPNGGALFYEGRGWGMNREDWPALARAALSELELEAHA